MSEAQLKAGQSSSRVILRYAEERDVGRITDIYNYYVIETPITFDLEPVSVENRREWLSHFSIDGSHRLFVAEDEGTVLGYAGSHQFRTKRAYDTTVETTVYLAPEAIGRGVGTLLYHSVFKMLEGQGLRTAIAGITMPNDASVALHARFGFAPAGVMHEVGYKFGRYWDVAWYEKRLA